MFSRKTIKKDARKQVKRHYGLLVGLCVLSIFLGTEFTMVSTDVQTAYDIIAGQETTLDAPGFRADRKQQEKIVTDFLNNDMKHGQKTAEESMKELKKSGKPGAVIGHRRGVLAAFMNSLNSGKLTVILGMGLTSIFKSQKAAGVILILLGLAATGLAWVFLQNMYRAILRRAFLESRRYDRVPLVHLLFFWTMKRWCRAALTLLLEAVYLMLWELTIVGGIIKRYSYFLVPFIVAENPDIKPRQAIRLSRKMMDGHKLECFKLELSFLGWMVLGFLTFGLVEVLWSVPYRMAAYTEYYARVRREAIEKGLPGAERLNDTYLFDAAEESLLHGSYEEILHAGRMVEESHVEMSPVQRFFAHNFGIWTGSMEEKRLFSKQQGLRQQMRIGKLEMEGKAYPQRLCPLWNKEVTALTGKVNYLAPCTIWSLIAVFFSFSIIGWCWEVSLHLVEDGEFVNRGVMHGPWLPIYGAGVTLIAVLLYRFRKHPGLEMGLVVILCGIVEYTSSLIMEESHGMRWWDYSGYFLNLNGRICGEGLMVFALGGMAAIYVLIPLIDNLVSRIKPAVLIPVCLVLCLCFTGDMLYTKGHPNTGKGITDYDTPDKKVAALVAPTDRVTAPYDSNREGAA